MEVPNVNVDVPEPPEMVAEGVNDAVIPAGRLLTDRATSPAPPFTGEELS